MQYTDFRNKSKYFLQKTVIILYKYKKIPDTLAGAAVFPFQKSRKREDINLTFEVLHLSFTYPKNFNLYGNTHQGKSLERWQA